MKQYYKDKIQSSVVNGDIDYIKNLEDKGQDLSWYLPFVNVSADIKLSYWMEYTSARIFDICDENELEVAKKEILYLPKYMEIRLKGDNKLIAQLGKYIKNNNLRTKYWSMNMGNVGYIYL